jgi:hypothetical protein
VTTWGDLTEQHIGRAITFTWPWATEPISATMLERTDIVGGVWDDDEQREYPANRNVLDLPDLGVQPVQLDNRLTVELGDSVELEPETTGGTTT